MSKPVTGGLEVALIVCTALVSPLQAKEARLDIAGMWGEPPLTIEGTFCAAACSDVGLEHLYKLLDDPANDNRPLPSIQSEALAYHIDHYVAPKLTAVARKNFPIDIADDPGLIRCEPWGAARQVFARHALEIRQIDDRLEFLYAEWHARRTIYLTPSADAKTRSPMGYSTGRYEGNELIVETTGISPAWMSRDHLPFAHSEQLKITEHYSLGKDGQLLLSAVLEDPVMLTEPLTLKKSWELSPETRIAAYDSCKPATRVFRKEER